MPSGTFQFTKVNAHSAPTTSVILLLFCYRCIKQKTYFHTGWMHKLYLKLLNLDSLLSFVFVPFRQKKLTT